MTETSNESSSMATSSTNEPQTTTSHNMEPPTANEEMQIPKPHVPIMIKTETESAVAEPEDDEDNRSTPEREIPIMPVRVKAEPREAIVNPEKPTSKSTTTTETATTTAIAPTNIKPEPTTASTNDETVPDELIDELLTTVDELANEDINNILPTPTTTTTTNETMPSTTSTTTTAATEVSSKPAIRVKSEMNLKSELPEAPDKIPEDFFDDLLPNAPQEPQQQQQKEPMIVEDLETKYAERLQELQDLKQLEKEAHKSKKKKKKNKKEKSKDREKEKDKESKSHKRKHDEISEHEHVENAEEQRDRFYDNLPSTSNSYRSDNNMNSFRVKSEFRRRSPLPMETTELECLPVQGVTAKTERDLGFKRIKLEKRTEPTTNVASTPQEKRVQAIQRAITAMNVCAKPPPLVAGNSNITPLEHFDYTSTVRKLPASNSHLTAEIYENRSPLHTVHNVSYKFSSSNTRMNLREWGLESMPAAVQKLATLLAYDANSLHRKLRTIKIPGKLQQKSDNSKSETMSDEIQSTYYTNAGTQTDAVRVVSVHDRQRKHDIGVQAKVAVGSIGSQTTTTVAALPMNGNTPLQRMFDTLNEHQQLAVLDFAELIRESGDSVLDMYQLRQRMLAIYNSAQVTKTTTNVTTMPPSMSRPGLAPHPADPRQRAGIAPTLTPNMNYPPQQMMLPHPAHNMGVAQAHAYTQPHPQHPQPAPPPHPNNMHFYPRY